MALKNKQARIGLKIFMSSNFPQPSPITSTIKEPLVYRQRHRAVICVFYSELQQDLVGWPLIITPTQNMRLSAEEIFPNPKRLFLLIIRQFIEDLTVFRGQIGHLRGRQSFSPLMQVGIMGQATIGLLKSLLLAPPERISARISFSTRRWAPVKRNGKSSTRRVVRSPGLLNTTPG